MLTSIRWRLVMGSVLLTLLTVSAVGVVALLLMQRYMAQQERAFLTANAESIAKQAVAYMSPVKVAPPLQQLAQTAAFLGDVTVRIVDNSKMPLADSGVVAVPAEPGTAISAPQIFFRVAQSSYYPADDSTGTEVYATDRVYDANVYGADVYGATGYGAAEASMSIEATEVMQPPLPYVVWTALAQEIPVPVTEALPVPLPVAGQESQVIVVQKSPSIWGDRLTFEAVAAMPVAAAESISYTIEPWMPGQAVPEGITTIAVTEQSLHRTEMSAVSMAQPTLAGEATGVAANDVENSSDPATVKATGKAVDAEVTKDQWYLKKMLAWNHEVNEDSMMTIQPSLLQLAGFESTDIVTAPIMTDGAVVGFVELGRSTDLVGEPLDAIRRALGIAAGASALLAIGVGLVMSRTLTSPIQNLAQAAAAMSSGDLTARAPVVGRDELASLALQFNQMADALHRSFVELANERDTLRRFVADASHELRTPITALRTFNELLQGPARTDREAQQEFLAESHAQIARLEWITRNLLDLSRWDGGMATLTMDEVELGELVTTAVTPFRALAQERQIDLRVKLPVSPIVMPVDEQRMGMALGNLLDNALKFTPDTGKVEVGVGQDDEGVKIWVKDTGMGISADDLPHIFARFYRSPRATQVGSGLGLAIVERIVNAHGATIRVESEEGAGSRFTLCMGCHHIEYSRFK